MEARYDGHADWYDKTFGSLGNEDGSAGVLAELIGAADPDDPICIDVGCGTGLHTAALRARGHTVIGVDLSADQLSIARSRNSAVAQADAARLPLPEGSSPTVVMTFIHTDVDDFGATVAEASRVLKPGGRLIYVGLHPSFVGAFVDRSGEPEHQELQITAGYGDESLQRDLSGRFPVRSRVGARNLTLSTFLGAFLAPDALRIEAFWEYDTNLCPWSRPSTDGRVVPWNVAITARAYT